MVCRMYMCTYIHFILAQACLCVRVRISSIRGGARASSRAVSRVEYFAIILSHKTRCNQVSIAHTLISALSLAP